MVSCSFHYKLEAGLGNWLNQGMFRILFYVLSTPYVENILEVTISRVFPVPDVCVLFDFFCIILYHITNITIAIC